jgi:hypothetical protein
MTWSGFNSLAKSDKLCNANAALCRHEYIDESGQWFQTFDQPIDMVTKLFLAKSWGLVKNDGSPILNFTEPGVGTVATSLAPTGAGTISSNRTTCTGKKALMPDGTCQDVPYILGKTAANFTVAETTATTPIYTIAVPANTLGTSSCVRIMARGEGLNNSGITDSFTIRVRYGGTGSAAQGISFASSATTRQGATIAMVCASTSRR